MKFLTTLVVSLPFFTNSVFCSTIGTTKYSDSNVSSNMNNVVREGTEGNTGGGNTITTASAEDNSQRERWIADAKNYCKRKGSGTSINGMLPHELVTSIYKGGFKCNVNYRPPSNRVLAQKRDYKDCDYLTRLYIPGGSNNLNFVVTVQDDTSLFGWEEKVNLFVQKGNYYEKLTKLFAESGIRQNTTFWVVAKKPTSQTLQNLDAIKCPEPEFSLSIDKALNVPTIIIHTKYASATGENSVIAVGEPQEPLQFYWPRRVAGRAVTAVFNYLQFLTAYLPRITLRVIPTGTINGPGTQSTYVLNCRMLQRILYYVNRLPLRVGNPNFRGIVTLYLPIRSQIISPEDARNQLVEALRNNGIEIRNQSSRATGRGSRDLAITRPMLSKTVPYRG